MGLPAFLQLIPEYREYVWGGERLRPGIVPTAEAWVIYEHDRLAGGALAGRSLAELILDHGADLLGAEVVRRTGLRFPLLIKLLDCARWLSLQVHPNDEQALRLEGPGLFGKTEAWHVLGAQAGSELIAGMRPGVTCQILEQAIQNGKAVLDLVKYLPVRAGDTLLMCPGTIHALGPGLLVYEVQQTSDLTYRVYDWDRPQTGGRLLHIEKSLAVADPSAQVQPLALPTLADGDRRVLCRSAYFQLEILATDQVPMELSPGGQSFQALTLIEGQATLETAAEAVTLKRFDSVVIPACTASYRLQPCGTVRALLAWVAPEEARL